MAFAALIPFIGTPIIWMPAALYKIFNGLTANNNSAITQGVLLMLYGVLIVSTIDNLLKPKIIGNKAKVHPIFVLLGVLGGLKLFGVIGLVIGPVILAVGTIIVRIYEEERGLIKSEAKS
jgi:predicted PurR-regulated permease PerM